jgi:hypothetical protein
MTTNESNSISKVTAWRQWRTIDMAIILLDIFIALAIVGGITTFVQVVPPAVSGDGRIEINTLSNGSEFFPDGSVERPRDERDASDPSIARARDATPGSLVIPTDSDVRVVVWDAAPTARAAIITRTVLMPAIVITGLLLLRGILRATRDGDPFTPRNASRVTRLGWLLLVGVPVIALLDLIAANTAFASQWAGIGQLPSDNGIYLLELPFAYLAPGLLVLSLAMAWRHGAELRDLEQATV